jgi:argininosuccinate lyase
MLAALGLNTLATEVAYLFVQKGFPFRETHHIPGRVVAESEELSVPMDQVSLEQLKVIDDRFAGEIYGSIRPRGRSPSFRNGLHSLVPSRVLVSKAVRMITAIQRKMAAR